MRKRDYDRHKRIYDFLLSSRIPFLSGIAARRVYDREFFLETETLKEQSAPAVAAIVSSYVRSHSVFDLGCGSGTFLKAFVDLGRDGAGCDLRPDLAREKGLTVFPADVCVALRHGKRYGLLLCFEVAEHIPARFSGQLVRNCCALSDRILFTAAPPGQGGVGHINEQPRDFWEGLFRESGYILETELAGDIKREMRARQVIGWLCDNLMLFRKE